MATSERSALQPEPQIRFAIKADLWTLAPASQRIRCFLTEHGVDTDAIFAIETVIEEIATNAIKYGFSLAEEGEIILDATAGADRVVLIIEDNGSAFDPTQVPEPEVHRALEEMPVGGLGIHLVRALTNCFEYKRLNGLNQVRVWVQRNAE